MGFASADAGTGGPQFARDKCLAAETTLFVKPPQKMRRAMPTQTKMRIIGTVKFTKVSFAF